MTWHWLNYGFWLVTEFIGHQFLLYTNDYIVYQQSKWFTVYYIIHPWFLPGPDILDMSGCELPSQRLSLLCWPQQWLWHAYLHWGFVTQTTTAPWVLCSYSLPWIQVSTRYYLAMEVSVTFLWIKDSETSYSCGSLFRDTSKTLWEVIHSKLPLLSNRSSPGKKRWNCHCSQKRPTDCRS
jgi:hypothetical protein